VFLRVGQRKNLRSSVRELQRIVDLEVHERVDLRAWTAMSVGGVAHLVMRCHSGIAVQQALDCVASHGLGWVTLGGGTRLVPPDGGIRVPILSLTGDLGRWEPELDGLVSGAGANLAQVCRAGIRSGLGGLDNLGSGEHSVGGLISAAVSGLLDLRAVVDWVELRRPGGAEPERRRWTDDGSARPAAVLHRRVVTRVRFKLESAPRSDSWPQGPSLADRRARGATTPLFIDPGDVTANDLLVEAGCGALAVGGVRLSSGELNGVVAGRSATSGDLLELCRKVRDRVLSTTGVELACALVFVDEDGREIGL
jgi:UDP-N-acetylenolpyruvoylglucosamine reductase